MPGIKVKTLGYTLAPELPQCVKQLVPNVTTLALLEILWSSFDYQPVKCHCLQGQAGCVATAICKALPFSSVGKGFYFNLTFSSYCDKLSLGGQMGKSTKKLAREEQVVVFTLLLHCFEVIRRLLGV